VTATSNTLTIKRGRVPVAEDTTGRYYGASTLPDTGNQTTTAGLAAAALLTLGGTLLRLGKTGRAVRSRTTPSQSPGRMTRSTPWSRSARTNFAARSPRSCRRLFVGRGELDQQYAHFRGRR
jgi:hypothetical protein